MYEDIQAPGLWRAYLRPYRARSAVLAAVLVVATTLPLAGPQLVRRFVDEASGGAPTTTLVGIAAGYLVIALATQAAQVYLTWASGRLAWTATNRMREDLTEHVLGLDMSFHGQHTAGELIDRVDGDVSRLAEFLSKVVTQMVGSALLLVGVVVVVVFEDPRVAIALVAFLVLATTMVLRLQRRTLPMALASREAMAQKFGNLEERLAAAEDLRTLGAGQHAVNRFHEACRHEFEVHRRYQMFSGATVGATSIVFALGTALVVGLGVLMYEQGTMSVGAVVMLFQYTTMVRRPVEQVISQSKELQEAAAGAARVRQLFATHSAIIQPAGGGITLPADAGPLAVSFVRVTFAYPGDTEVLHDVSLEVGAGRSLAVVGRTGSGKTTLGRLLLRLYDPTEGAVRVGGTDLRDASPESLRRCVRAVTQDVQLFSGDVRDNLTLFADEADDDAIESVLDDLGLGRWRSQLPDGLDTRLGVGAAGLSAGEAQLLAFARVFLADPRVVILDEATSRLDPATEHLIERAIDRLLRDRTAIVIAHRLSSLDRVDDVAVLEAGRVVEFGARDQLAADADSRFGHLLAASTASL
jgi:ATP-binding cassette, subfamily B, bacterial